MMEIEIIRQTMEAQTKTRAIRKAEKALNEIEAMYARSDRMRNATNDVIHKQSFYVRAKADHALAAWSAEYPMFAVNA